MEVVKDKKLAMDNYPKLIDYVQQKNQTTIEM